MRRRNIQTSFIVLLLIVSKFSPGQDSPRFHLLVMAENGGHHIAFSTAMRPWLDSLAKAGDFSVTYISSPAGIDSAFLSHFQVFFQEDYAPYGWPPVAVKAFQDYIEKGRGGWIGLHHATLLGEFDGFPMWNWFSGFMGGIRYKNYIADFRSGEVKVEKPAHPVMKGVPAQFLVGREEWYTWESSPRPKVEVLASVDEKTYKPDTDIKMGDHPVIWSNPAMKARNVYIFMGHGPDLMQNAAYMTIVKNAIYWTAGK